MNEDLSKHIDAIKDVDEKIFLVIKASFTDLIKDVSNSKYPNTGKAMAMLVTKSNFIKNAIFDTCENDNLYSANILYRSLIEHFLRHQYIFINFAKTKDDDIGSDYYKYCDMGENFDYLKAINSSKKIFDPDYIEIDAWEELSKFDSKFNECTAKELKQKIERFQYRNIIRFIASSIPIKDIILQKIIPAYAELSSFVHGGPYAEDILLTNQKEETRILTLKNICEMTFSISKSIKSFTYLFAFQINKKYGTFYNQINEALIKI